MKGRNLVIGFGNPLRGDDGLGWEVARRLSASLKDDSFDVRMVHQLTPELIEPISEAELVIFVDASVQGIPGSWKCEEVRAGSVSPALFEHNFGVERLLDYADTLLDAHPRALLITVTAENFDHCDHLSPTIEAVLPDIMGYIRNELSAQNLRLESVSLS